MLRFKWSFVQAFWATLTWTILLIALVAIFGNNEGWGQVFAWFCLAVLVVPFVYRWRQFYKMFAIHLVYDANYKSEVRIGHKQEFVDKYGEKPWPGFHVLLDNGLIVQSPTHKDALEYQRILAEGFVYKKYFTLISNCKIDTVYI